MAARSNSRRGDSLIPFMTVLADAIAIETAFLLSYWLRFSSTLFDHLGFVNSDAPSVHRYLLGSLVVIPIWLMLFQSRKMYAARRNVSLADEFISVVKVVSLGMLMVMSATFFYRGFSYSRVVFGLLWGSSMAFLMLGRLLVYEYERSRYRAGKLLQPAIIVGRDTGASHVFTRLHKHPSFGFTILGYFAEEPAQTDSALSTAPYLGPIAGAPEFIREHKIQLAFIAVTPGTHAELFDLITQCEGVNIDFMMVPDVLEILTSQVKVLELEDIPFLKIKSIPFTAWGRITKRAFDLAVSGILLAILSPFLLLIGLLIRLDSRGPVLFRQQRVGLDGKEFTMYKFRSMRAGSEQLDAHAGLGIPNDPRRTRIGALLRATSLDELPQLFNVLKGEMSLVGPRPERTTYVREFQTVIPRYLDRHRVKTGVTGWAQVHGLRGDTSLEERIKYDLYYIENWSLALDVKILLRTMRAALRSREDRPS